MSLAEHEVEALLERLDAEQREHLAKHDYVWTKELGLLWKDAKGVWRHTKFTHGTYFRTAAGEFHIDSGGRVRRVLPD